MSIQSTLHGRIRQTVICKQCGKQYDTYNHPSHFCSLPCKSLFQTAVLDFSKIVSLYESGKTQEEIAVEMSVGRKAIYNLFRRHGYQCRKATPRNQDGENNPRWKGADASYSAFHLRVEKLKGKPKKCEVCGECSRRKYYDWANMTGRYEDPSDYKRMCRSCHRKLDGQRRREIGENTTARVKGKGF